MKTELITIVFAGLMLVAHAEPMTSSVTSWQGAFRISGQHTVIQSEGMPNLLLWLYQTDKKDGDGRRYLVEEESVTPKRTTGSSQERSME